MHKPVLAQPGDVIGLTRKGKAIHLIGGGSEPAVEPPVVPPPPSTVRVPVAPPPPPPTSTVDLNDPAVIELLERARQQEKDKLYPSLEELRAQQAQQAEQLRIFTEERAEREKREQEAIAAAEAAAEEKRLAELSFTERLSEFQQQMQAQVGGLTEQLAQRDAVLEMERKFTELVQYKNARLSTTDENDPASMILPELRDLVTGNNREEIDASISVLAERSGSILQQVAQATGQARQQARGVGVTAPPVGPLDNNSGYETVSAEDIRGMDMSTYAANRGRLLGAASQQQSDRGMFG